MSEDRPIEQCAECGDWGDAASPTGGERPAEATVLVVDGEPTSRRFIRGLLESLGYAVQEANNALEAVRLVRDGAPAVVLLDVILPPLDGFAVCRALKEDPATALVPIVLVAAQDGPAARRRSLEVGADDIVIKPVDDTELAVRVRSLAHRSRLQAQLHSSEQVLSTLAAAIEAKDAVTGGHCTRISHNAERFGASLGLSSDERSVLRWAGTLHDVGKVGVPDEVLKKPGPLSPAEWQVVRRHPAVGEAILRPLEGLAPVLPVVRSHHERWDGAGYPDGLAGAAIPFLARVFQIVDVFDALTAPRHYKPALPIDQVIDIMTVEAGRVLDPELFHHFGAHVAPACEIAEPPPAARVEWDPWANRDPRGDLAPGL